MTTIANEPRNVEQRGSSLAPLRSNHPFDGAAVEGPGKLDSLKERWSEISSLLTLDFWADFFLVFVYTCLTAVALFMLEMAFSLNR
jgi:hypothetical protein